MHPIERASIVHVDFVGFHPFIDGNGRTARWLLNFELMKNGYSPIVIPKEY
ncbi:Fic family protein [Paenibacillus sp. DS2015]|uniref:Fic family protein n=1 Tax=Paenibacillus sp. DS2015 TaxID=3373917 RepID=UPI003D197DB7